MIPKLIVLHHSVSSRDNTTLSDIDAWHRLRWPNFKSSMGYWVGYHWVIVGNGMAFQTRQNNEIGAHCIPNDGKVGICLTGNFEEEKPSPEQLNSLGVLLEKLKKDYNLTDKDIKGHRELSQTLCPGRYLMEWLKLYRQLGLIQQLIEKIKAFLKGRRK